MQDDYLSNDPGDNDFLHDPAQSRQRSSTNWSVILIGLFAAGGLLLVVLCCGGGWFAFRFGMGVLTEEVRSGIEDNPVIQENIGTIETLSMDYTKSAAVEGDDVFVFRIEGDKGSGYVTVESVTNAAGMEEVAGGSLKLDSGETIPLLPAETAPADTAPADAEPADVEPADAEPADAEPADVEPADDPATEAEE